MHGRRVNVAFDTIGDDSPTRSMLTDAGRAASTVETSPKFIARVEQGERTAAIRNVAAIHPTPEKTSAFGLDHEHAEWQRLARVADRRITRELASGVPDNRSNNCVVNIRRNLPAWAPLL